MKVEVKSQDALMFAKALQMILIVPCSWAIFRITVGCYGLSFNNRPYKQSSECMGLHQNYLWCLIRCKFAGFSSHTLNWNFMGAHWVWKWLCYVDQTTAWSRKLKHLSQRARVKWLVFRKKGQVLFLGRTNQYSNELQRGPCYYIKVQLV